MTTVMEEQDVKLENAIAALGEEIARARVGLAEWEEKNKSASKFLAELRAERTEICADAVLGKTSQGAVNKNAAQIADVESKVTGIERIVSVKRSELSELQSSLQPLHAEQSRLAQARLIAEEQEKTSALLTEAERVLAVRDSAAKRFIEALIQLRSSTYRSEGARRTAFDGAQALERQSMGMRP